ncbi:MAG: hypothetical protein FWH11_01425 [Micrococcales bacterium]|nr:hypothetical protein [Micrococcales bacterium]
MADEPRLFADFIREQAGGKTHDELTENLADLAFAVRETGKPGTLTLRLEVRPMKGVPGAVQISDQIGVKTPKTDRPAPVFFVTDTGRVQKDDPMQPTFEGLREITTTEIREAN